MISQRGRGRTIKWVGNLQLSHNFLKTGLGVQNFSMEIHHYEGGGSMISLPDEASGPETGCLTGVPYIEKPRPFISPNLPYMVILRDFLTGF